jgi:transposase InsO family protein
VVIDSFTKAIELIPIVNMKAKTVALVLVEKVYLVQGCPEVLVSDQGTHFVNAILKEINNILQVKHVTTTAYHQQANGSAERVIQTIKKLLAMTVKGQTNKWEELLPYVRFAYMNNIHTSTGLTPFFMLYCRDPIFPMDLPTDPRYTRVFYDYDTGMKHRILTNAKIIHDYARQTLEEQTNRQKRGYDKKTAPSDFHEAQIVYLSDAPPLPGVSKFFRPLLHRSLQNKKY